MTTTARRPSRLALVLGDRDLVLPLHMAGVSALAVCEPRSPVRFSRYSAGWLKDPRPDENALLANLLERAAEHPRPVGLFYEEDDDLLFVSRHREQLSQKLRFVVAARDLVEQFVDKARFQQLVDRLDLPAPQTRLVDPTDEHVLEELSFPLLVKPVRRTASWREVTPAKAVVVMNRAELEALRAALPTGEPPVIAQQLIPGPETRIESYHVYVDSDGSIAAEFTGRKVRTFPQAMGHSTALETTDSPDVVALGRLVVERTGLIGVAKVDFKRDLDGRLWLLEVNPRFNLWHHLGAVAGVNIPAVVWADLMGERRPRKSVARAGVRWCRVQQDFRAAREQRVPFLRWLRWAGTAEARTLHVTDPLPALSKALAPTTDHLRRLIPDRG